MGRDQEELIRVILNTLDKLENKLDKLHEKLDNSHSEVSEVGLRVSKLEGQVGGIRNLFKFLGSVVAATAGSIIYMIYELVTGK